MSSATRPSDKVGFDYSTRDQVQRKEVQQEHINRAVMSKLIRVFFVPNPQKSSVKEVAAYFLKTILKYDNVKDPYPINWIKQTGGSSDTMCFKRMCFMYHPMFRVDMHVFTYACVRQYVSALTAEDIDGWFEELKRQRKSTTTTTTKETTLKAHTTGIHEKPMTATTATTTETTTESITETTTTFGDDLTEQDDHHGTSSLQDDRDVVAASSADSSDSSMLYIILATIAVLILALSVIIVLLMVFKKRRATKRTKRLSAALDEEERKRRERAALKLKSKESRENTKSKEKMRRIRGSVEKSNEKVKRSKENVGKSNEKVGTDEVFSAEKQEKKKKKKKKQSREKVEEENRGMSIDQLIAALQNDKMEELMRDRSEDADPKDVNRMVKELQQKRMAHMMSKEKENLYE